MLLNRWARRHAAALRQGLDPDETLLAARLVSVKRSGMVDEGRGRMGRARWRMDVRSTARAAGLEIEGTVFVLGVTERRVVTWSVTRLMAAPNAPTGSTDLADIATITPVGRIGSRRVAIVFGTGHVLVIRAEQGSLLNDVVAAFGQAKRQ